MHQVSGSDEFLGNDNREEVVTTNDVEVTREIVLIETQGSGNDKAERVVRHQVAAGGSNLTTTTSYYDDTSKWYHLMKKKEVRPDGSWSFFSYNWEGSGADRHKIIREYSPFKSTPSTAIDDASPYEGANPATFTGKVVERAYQKDVIVLNGLSVPNLVWEKTIINGAVVEWREMSRTVSNGELEVTTKTHLDGSETKYLKSITTRYADAGMAGGEEWLAGRLISQVGPEETTGTPTRGTHVSYAQLDDLALTGGGNVAPTVTYTEGSSSFAGYKKTQWSTPELNNVSEVTVSIYDSRDRMHMSTRYISTGSGDGAKHSDAVSKTIYVYDDFGRQVEVWRDDFKMHETNYENNYNRDYVIEYIGENGVVTLTEMDDQGRVVASVKADHDGTNDLITTYSYNTNFTTGVSRTTTRRDSATYSYPGSGVTLPNALTSYRDEDHAGRIIKSIDEAGLTTTYAYAKEGNYWKETTTHPNTLAEVRNCSLMAAWRELSTVECSERV